MICNKCSGEKFRTVNTVRNRKWSEDKQKFVYSPDHDYRKILCEGCNSIFFVETTKIFVSCYDSTNMRLIRVEPRQLGFWEGDK